MAAVPGISVVVQHLDGLARNLLSGVPDVVVTGEAVEHSGGTARRQDRKPHRDLGGEHPAVLVLDQYHAGHSVIFAGGLAFTIR